MFKIRVTTYGGERRVRTAISEVKRFRHSLPSLSFVGLTAYNYNIFYVGREECSL